MRSISFLIRWKVLPMKRNTADKKVLPAAILLRFSVEYNTASWFSRQRSVTIRMLPLNTDPLIAAYAGHFKQYRNKGYKQEQSTRYLVSSLWLLIGWSLACILWLFVIAWFLWDIRRICQFIVTNIITRFCLLLLSLSCHTLGLNYHFYFIFCFKWNCEIYDFISMFFSVELWLKQALRLLMESMILT